MTRSASIRPSIVDNRASSDCGAAVRPYADGADEILDHLQRLNRLLRQAVDRFRGSRAIEARNGLDGIAIFEDEIDGFLASDPDLAGQMVSGADADRERCASRAAASVMELPVDTIRRRFDLDPVETDAILHCLAVELHPGYGRVFGYLNNDLTRQRPSVALLMEVLAASWPERLAVRRALAPMSALFRFGLIVPFRPGGDHLTMDLMLDPAVLDVLLRGQSAQDAASGPRDTGTNELLISVPEQVRLDRIIAHLRRTTSPATVLLSGAMGSGRRTCAEAVCRTLHRRLLVTGKHEPASSLLAALPSRLRDARLGGDTLGIYVPRVMADDVAPLPPLLDALTACGAGLTFLFVDSDTPPRLTGPRSAGILRLHLDAPRTALRMRAWRQALDKRTLGCSDETIASVSSVYPFNVGRIHAAAADADLRSRIETDRSRYLDLQALAQVCREQADHRMERLAESLPKRHGWDDIVLPSDEFARLKEIAGAVRNRDRVMDEWGFGQKVSAGPGVNAIFFGPSGTGKTMAASILAGELGMAIYRVDLSRVVSKYIGETERNLDALFEEARRSFALLFFDEAEALFGKRSEVKDAHDRYANIEIAYLLQRMERFEGVAILATNLRKHLDNAFLRRLQFAVEFPLPTAADRLRIWRQVWPRNAMLSDDIDFDFMASHLELSGGHIRNVALTAAFLASEHSEPIGMRHLLAATRREMQKLGRSCVPDQFGRYAPLLRSVA
jgi:hypothetical protein